MRDLAYQEDGFTLVEMLVAITLSLIVLFATLQSLDVFSSEAAKQTRVTDANDQVRATMDRVVRDLRGAAEIKVATATNLVYTVPTQAGYRAERICVESADLYGVRTQNLLPTGVCSSLPKLANLKSTTRTAFTYDGDPTPVAPATAATVKNVGLTFSLDASGGGRTGSSTLRASAAVRRSVAMLPPGPKPPAPECPEAGPLVHIGAKVFYSEDVAVDGIGVLSVSYTTDTGLTIDGGTIDPQTGSPPRILPKTVTKVVAKVTDSLGIVRALIPQNVECDYT